MKRIESLLVKKEETLFNVFKLRSMARPDDTLAVLMYGSPDPDAVASAMALREIFKQAGGLKKFAFVATEEVLRQQNKEFIKAMKVNVQLLHKVNLQEYRLLALVDAQPTFFGKVCDAVHPQIVLDHHPVTSAWHAELADVRPHYGALSTIMTEYLLAAKVRIPKMLYTALLYGIKSDTNNFERDSILEDIGAYYLNASRANRQLIRRIELNQIPERYLKYFEHAYFHRRRYRDRVTSFLGKVESPDVCVQVADFYLRIADIYYVVIAGVIKDRLVIVFRGDGYRQDCGSIAEKAFGKYGSAGGHKSAARVEILLETLKEVLQGEWSQESVEQFLVQRLRQQRPAKNRKQTANNEKEAS
ncbi:MAG: Phosphoesterase [Thermodesulfobacteriota bacterium]|jgi:nanoRNase/pAp phosphatase (c-di-AMP/oligoRNAs hydrolase)|nr:Phosphoesterase [Thermodesulfobacteriota bacterium]